MALKIRLARGGAKKKPFYRIVVAEATAPRDGRFIEKVGTYNPMLEHGHPDRLRLVNERVQYWLGVGAQPTERVALFLGKSSLMVMPEYHERPLKSKPKKKAQERVIAIADAKIKAEADAKAAVEAAAQAKLDAKAAAEAAAAEAAAAPEPEVVAEVAAPEAVEPEATVETAPEPEVVAEVAAAPEVVAEEVAAPAEEAAPEAAAAETPAEEAVEEKAAE